MKPHAARTLRVAFCAASLFTTGALAQVDPAVTANTRRDLIRQAQEARTQGDHARAVELATRAGELGINVALRRFIAEEQVAAGLIGPALTSARLCVTDADHDASPGREPHLAACRALQTSLGVRVGRVVVEATMVPGMVVRLNDAELSSSAWGTPQVVTPGAVLVTATAPGQRPFHAVLDVAAGATSNVRVSFGGSASTAVGATTTPPAEARGPINPAPFVVLGIGAAAVVAGGVFFVLRGSAIDARDNQCDASGCPEAARADHDRAVSFNTATNVSMGVGAALVAGGLVWYLVAPRRAATTEQSAPARRAGPWVSPANGGAMLGWQGTL